MQRSWAPSGTTSSWAAQVLRLDSCAPQAHLQVLADIHEKKQVRWIMDNCEQVPRTVAIVDLQIIDLHLAALRLRYQGPVASSMSTLAMFLTIEV